ncbi:MAG: carnitine 3-dehydrogenase [Rhodomicrobiaceae bacterium]
MSGQAAIIGGGVIGGGWAARFLLMGWDVALFDPDTEAERKIGEVLDNARRSLPGLYDVALPAEGRLRYCTRIEDAVAAADWIQESVPERLDLKHAIFSEVQANCRHDAIVASSTSGFKPSELHAGAARPDQIIVAHPFNPVYLLPLVELVGADETIRRAQEHLARLGMKPLHVRHEIEAHIADRLLEAVWREALWLIRDGIATTAEIDDAIRFGFGLRWAQMGLFETYRIAGGEAGMAHFVEQFGPALQWPWTKLTNVPELTGELVNKIAAQSDAQSGHHSIRGLERIRDDNLVAIMRALKGRNSAAGALLNAEDMRRTPVSHPASEGPIRTVARSVPVDWTDYNGHMNESRYGQVFCDAADRILALIGAGPEYIASGFSFFTVETRISFRRETHHGDRIHVDTVVSEGAGKKLRLHHVMRDAESDTVLAMGEQLLIHVSLSTRRACEPASAIGLAMTRFADAHRGLSK